MLKYFIFLTINGLLVIAACSWFKANIQFDVLMNNIQHFNMFALLISSIPYCLLIIAYAVRTKLIIKQSFIKSFSINIIGHGLNNICPFRLGEILKILFVKRFYGISIYELGFGTIAEKTLDLICLSCLGFIYIALTNNVDHFKALMCMFILAMIIIYIHKKKIYMNSLFWKRLYLDKYFKKISDAVEYCNIENNLGIIFLWSMIIWLLTLLNFDFYFRFQLENVHFTFLDSILMVLITTLALAVPVSIGNFGLFEGAMVYYLQTRFQFTTEYALALALILHLSIVIPQLLGMSINILYKEWKLFYRNIYARNFNLKSA